MKNWKEIIEANWDAAVEAMQKAAWDVEGSDGGSELRVELTEDGKVSTYWTFQNIISPEVREGEAIVIGRYYGGEAWSEDWADTYDAAFDLEMLLGHLQGW